MSAVAKTIAIAPMMGYTDRHFCHLLRQFHPQLMLYTEMVTTGQVLHDQRPGNITARQSCSHPIAVQMAGCDPTELAQAALKLAPYHYDEINLNIGCPSARVAAARYGVCLMKEPSLVARCVQALVAVSPVPVTVKTRVGVDDFDQYHHLTDFVAKVATAGCSRFIIHARKAWLGGLNPRQNRSVPPLEIDKVYRLKADFPELDIIINGGIKTVAEVDQHLQHTDGVMLGRVTYQNTALLPAMIARVYPQDPVVPIEQVVVDYLDYILVQTKKDGGQRALIKPLFGLFHGQPNAAKKRQLLDNMFSAASYQELSDLVFAFKDFCYQLV